MSVWADSREHLLSATIVFVTLIMVLSSGATLTQVSPLGQAPAAAPGTSLPNSLPSASTGSASELGPARQYQSFAPLDNSMIPSGSNVIAPNVLGAYASAAPAGSATSQLAPWAQKALGIHDAATANVRTVASYPNIQFLKNPHAQTGMINPGYSTVAPAPMGIADYGLGSTGPYAYNTTHFLGQVSLNSMPNVTDPASEGMIIPGANAVGFVGSVYEFGIQLNTVLTNVSLPNGVNNEYWTQNVVDINDTGIHFVDDIYNVSSMGFGISPGTTFLSDGCASQPSTTAMLSVMGGMYQCVGTTIPIKPTDFPLTLQFYNNASVTGGGNDQIIFGYNFVGANGFHSTGIEANPTFTGKAVPASPIGFEVSGKYSTPAGLYYDSELTFAGQIGGTNAVFRSLNGSVQLEYSNQFSGGWKNVPSAYDAGGNTAESATGISEYWPSSGTVDISAGPSFIEGLWNSEASLAVPAGDIQLKGTISPDYGFLFASVGPVTLNATNVSWVPSTNTGNFDTFLPALPAGKSYNTVAFAPESAELNGTAFTTSQTNYAVTLTAKPGFLDAPLYMNGNNQASSLAKNVTGSSVAPWKFSNLHFVLNNSFNYVNDFGFPVFEMFQAESLTSTVVANNLSQVGNMDLISDKGGTSYPGAAGYFGMVNEWLDQSPVSSNLTINPMCFYECIGEGVFLWKDTHALAWNITVDSSQFGGVYTGDSVSTAVDNMLVLGGVGVEDVGARFTKVWNMDDLYGTDGILPINTFGAQYVWFNDSSTNYAGISNSGDLYMGPGPYAYYNIPGGNDTTILHSANRGYTWGITLEDTIDAQVLSSTVYGGGQMGAGFFESVGTTVKWFNMTGKSVYGLYFDATTYDNITNFDMNLSSNTGIFATNSDHVAVEGMTANQYSEGFFSQYCTNVSFSTGTASEGAMFISTAYDDQFVFSQMVVNQTSYAMQLSSSFNGTVSNFLVNNSTAGIYSIGGDQLAVSALTTNATTFGMLYDGTTNVTVNGATFYYWHSYSPSYYQYYGIYGLYSAYDSFSGVTCYFENSTQGYGVYLYQNSHVTASNLVGSMHTPLGGYTAFLFFANGGAYYNINTVTATGSSVTQNWVYAVYLDQISQATVTGVTVTWGMGVDAMFGSAITVATVTVSAGEGVYFYQITSASITAVTASAVSWTMWVDDSSDITITNTVISGWSVGVGVGYSSNVEITGVQATNTSLAAPWSGNNNYWNSPVAAVLTQNDFRVTIIDVTASLYPIGLFDTNSQNLLVNGFNASGGDYAMVLNGTYDGTFAGVGAFQDIEGIQLNNGAFQNAFFTCSFVGDSSYGVDIESGTSNFVYNNNFIGDNGATSTYNELHIQAFSVPGNYFNSSAKIGNYWADWHSYNAQGHLNPYYVSDGVWDYYPLGVRMGDTAVYFNEVGLPSGTTWSVTLNGTSASTSNTWMILDAGAGASTFTVGTVTGYSSNPTTGTVTGGTLLATNETIVFAPIPPVPQTYTVTLAETGLPTNTSWAATFNGVAHTGSATSLVYTVRAGVYNYQVAPVSGYSSSPTSGSVNVTGNYTLWITFTNLNPPKPTYTVTIQETGLPNGANWTASFNGVPQTTSTTGVSFTTIAGTYSYAVNGVAGYTVSPASGSISVTGNYTVSVTFTQVKYIVTVQEGGLSGGIVWSATVNGVSQSTAGPSLTFSEANGSYAYSVGSVTGYTLSCGSGSSGTVTVAGSDVTVGCQFTAIPPKPGPAVASQSDLQTYFIIAVVVGIAALVVAILALLWRRKSQGSQVPPPAAAPTSSPPPASPPEPNFAGPSSSPPPPPR